MNLYEALGLRPDPAREASREAIREAYRRLVKTKHPDVGGDAEEFRQIKLAHDILIDDERRARYDATGEITETPAENATAQLMTVLSEVFEKAIDGNADPTQVDIVAAMHEAITKKRAELSQQRQVCETIKTKLERCAGRFARSDGSNLLEDIRRAKLEMAATALGNLAKKDKPLADAQEMLRSHSFQYERPAPPDLSQGPYSQMGPDGRRW